jgi:glycosyltransferase involved in cell wall biosynthesis
LPKPWIVVAVGRDECVGAALKQQAAALRVSGNIMWLGERSEVEDLLAASDIFVLPSHQEGFSNALLEAMAANLTVVATAVGGNVDAVIDNETGLLVDAGDPPALAAAMLRLAKDPQLRRRLAGAARARVEQQFTLEACVGHYEKLYRAVSEPNPAPVGKILADIARESARRETAAVTAHAT